MNKFSRISPDFSAEPLPLLPWAPERNGEASLPAPPPRPGFWARLAAWLGLHA
ncbi:hypothetical protein ACLF3G_10740 [Falsiroseomonas sp. HC035]|uniref:hypothetical protein n=1 Tax=Falsiroseomonas sp. HC035 TaxID=3390999 RepID=UPI003D323628